MGISVHLKSLLQGIQALSYSITSQDAQLIVEFHRLLPVNRGRACITALQAGTVDPFVRACFFVAVSSPLSEVFDAYAS
ncbi:MULTISPECIES: hypothetical protein [Amycolatopsis]|uniref:hypothetical protein n=1 Tax=Amycolatopsis TaxID=1813 RepID=UPI00174CBDA0|nr:hypothetical protein [Amycolatopsis bullii]